MQTFQLSFSTVEIYRQDYAKLCVLFRTGFQKEISNLVCGSYAKVFVDIYSISHKLNLERETFWCCSKAMLSSSF